jgi:hypothetical protein
MRGERHVTRFGIRIVCLVVAQDKKFNHLPWRNLIVSRGPSD